MRPLLNQSEEETAASVKEAARNQYRATLELMSFEAVFKLAWEEHGIRGKASHPKAELIQKILEAKYG